MNQLEKAIIQATNTFEGMRGRNNKLLIIQSLEVAMLVDTVKDYSVFRYISEEAITKSQAVCILHDLVENTKSRAVPVRLSDLQGEGFDQDVLDAVADVSRSLSCGLLSKLALGAILISKRDNKDISEQEFTREFQKIVGEVTEAKGENNSKDLHSRIEVLKEKQMDDVVKQDELDTFISQYTDNVVDLTVKQANAIKMALTNTICVLDGANGTGVTETIIAMIQTLKNCKPESVVRVFSGNVHAKDRLEVRLGMKVSTINDLIEDELIDGELIIATEVHQMMEAELVNIISSNQDARILLVGNSDKHPIKNGVCLSELVELHNLPSVKLTKSFYR